MTVNFEHHASRVLLSCAAVVVILAGIKAAATIVVPLALSVFIAIICHPLVRVLQRWRFPKMVAILSIILLIILIGVSIANVVGQSLADLSRFLPQYQQRINSELLLVLNKLAQYGFMIEPRELLSQFDPSAAMSLAVNTLSGLGNVLTNTFLILLVVVFMLLEAQSLPHKIHLALDDAEHKMQQLDRFVQSVNRYLAIKTVMSLLTGTIIGVILWLLDVKYPLLWAVLTFLLNYIPNIGSIIAAIPAILMAFIDGGLVLALFTASGFLAVNMLIGNMIEPRFMGRGLGLSTLVVFLSLIFWGWLLGTVGMLLSVPLTMIVKIALESSASGHWLAVLLDSEQNHPVTTVAELTAPEETTE